ncbi:MAG TPA: hypothetical protein VMT34_03105 [Aggregatilineales bacterium]|nr:hypothetical protein [Aggregatilineales bacterium]
MVQSKLRLVVLVTIMALMASASPVSAGGSSPNVAVTISSGQPNASTITTFAPDGTSAGKIPVPDSTRATVSPSLQWYSTLTTDASHKLQYAPLTKFKPAAPIDVKVEPGFEIISAQFNWDSAYLLYLLAKLDGNQYILGILELKTGKQVEYGGTYSVQIPANTRTAFGGVPNPLYLEAESGRLILNTFLPFAGGNSGGLYETYTGNFAPLQPGRYPLPPVNQIATRDQYTAFSGVQSLSSAPEGLKQLAYFSKNPNNPPANYQEAPFSQSYNVLTILDLITGKTTIAAQAGKGQGLETSTWSPLNPIANPPGDKVYFTGGNYQNTAFISQPRLYTLQVTTNAVTEGPVLTTDPLEDVAALLVCTNTTQDTLYFVGTKTDAATQAFTATLYTAPLNDLAKKKALVTGNYINLVSCVPPVS